MQKLLAIVSGNMLKSIVYCSSLFANNNHFLRHSTKNIGPHHRLAQGGAIFDIIWHSHEFPSQVVASKPFAGDDKALAHGNQPPHQGKDMGKVREIQRARKRRQKSDALATNIPERVEDAQSVEHIYKENNT